MKKTTITEKHNEEGNLVEKITVIEEHIGTYENPVNIPYIPPDYGNNNPSPWWYYPTVTCGVGKLNKVD